MQVNRYEIHILSSITIMLTVYLGAGKQAQFFLPTMNDVFTKIKEFHNAPIILK